MVFFRIVPDLDYFCFCFNLRTGNILIGFYYLLVSVMNNIWFLFHPCYAQILGMDCPIRELAWQMAFVENAVSTITVVFSTGFLFGIYGEIKCLVTCFIYILFGGAIALPITTHMIFFILSAVHWRTTCFFAPYYCLCIIHTIVTVPMALYFVRVVKSYRSTMNLNLEPTK